MAWIAMMRVGSVSCVLDSRAGEGRAGPMRMVSPGAWAVGPMRMGRRNWDWGWREPGGRDSRSSWKRTLSFAADP